MSGKTSKGITKRDGGGRKEGGELGKRLAPRDEVKESEESNVDIEDLDWEEAQPGKLVLPEEQDDAAPIIEYSPPRVGPRSPPRKSRLPTLLPAPPLLPAPAFPSPSKSDPAPRPRRKRTTPQQKELERILKGVSSDQILAKATYRDYLISSAAVPIIHLANREGISKLMTEAKESNIGDSANIFYGMRKLVGKAAMVDALNCDVMIERMEKYRQTTLKQKKLGRKVFITIPGSDDLADVLCDIQYPKGKVKNVKKGTAMKGVESYGIIPNHFGMCFSQIDGKIQRLSIIDLDRKARILFHRVSETKEVSIDKKQEYSRDAITSHDYRILYLQVQSNYEHFYHAGLEIENKPALYVSDFDRFKELLAPYVDKLVELPVFRRAMRLYDIILSESFECDVNSPIDGIELLKWYNLRDRVIEFPLWLHEIEVKDNSVHVDLSNLYSAKGNDLIFRRTIDRDVLRLCVFIRDVMTALDSGDNVIKKSLPRRGLFLIRDLKETPPRQDEEKVGDLVFVAGSMHLHGKEEEGGEEERGKHNPDVLSLDSLLSSVKVCSYNNEASWDQYWKETPWGEEIDFRDPKRFFSTVLEPILKNSIKYALIYHSFASTLLKATFSQFENTIPLSLVHLKTNILTSICLAEQTPKVVDDSVLSFYDVPLTSYNPDTSKYYNSRNPMSLDGLDNKFLKSGLPSIPVTNIKSDLGNAWHFAERESYYPNPDYLGMRLYSRICEVNSKAGSKGDFDNTELITRHVPIHTGSIKVATSAFSYVGSKKEGAGINLTTLLNPKNLVLDPNHQLEIKEDESLITKLPLDVSKIEEIRDIPSKMVFFGFPYYLVPTRVFHGESPDTKRGESTRKRGHDSEDKPKTVVAPPSKRKQVSKGTGEEQGDDSEESQKSGEGEEERTTPKKKRGSPQPSRGGGVKRTSRAPVVRKKRIMFDEDSGVRARQPTKKKSETTPKSVPKRSTKKAEVNLPYFDEKILSSKSLQIIEPSHVFSKERDDGELSPMFTLSSLLMQERLLDFIWTCHSHAVKAYQELMSLGHCYNAMFHTTVKKKDGPSIFGRMTKIGKMQGLSMMPCYTEAYTEACSAQKSAFIMVQTNYHKLLQSIQYRYGISILQTALEYSIVRSTALDFEYQNKTVLRIGSGTNRLKYRQALPGSDAIMSEHPGRAVIEDRDIQDRRDVYNGFLKRFISERFDETLGNRPYISMILRSNGNKALDIKLIFNPYPAATSSIIQSDASDKLLLPSESSISEIFDNRTGVVGSLRGIFGTDYYYGKEEEPLFHPSSDQDNSEFYKLFFKNVFGVDPPKDRTPTGFVEKGCVSASIARLEKSRSQDFGKEIGDYTHHDVFYKNKVLGASMRQLLKIRDAAFVGEDGFCSQSVLNYGKTKGKESLLALIQNKPSSSPSGYVDTSRTIRVDVPKEWMLPNKEKERALFQTAGCDIAALKHRDIPILMPEVPTRRDKREPLKNKIHGLQALDDFNEGEIIGFSLVKSNHLIKPSDLCDLKERRRKHVLSVHFFDNTVLDFIHNFRKYYPIKDVTQLRLGRIFDGTYIGMQLPFAGKEDSKDTQYFSFFNFLRPTHDKHMANVEISYGFSDTNLSLPPPAFQISKKHVIGVAADDESIPISYFHLPSGGLASYDPRDYPKYTLLMKKWVHMCQLASKSGPKYAYIRAKRYISAGDALLVYAHEKMFCPGSTFILHGLVNEMVGGKIQPFRARLMDRDRASLDLQTLGKPKVDVSVPKVSVRMNEVDLTILFDEIGKRIVEGKLRNRFILSAERLRKYISSNDRGYSKLKTDYINFVSATRSAQPNIAKLNCLGSISPLLNDNLLMHDDILQSAPLFFSHTKLLMDAIFDDQKWRFYSKSMDTPERYSPRTMWNVCSFLLGDESPFVGEPCNFRTYAELLEQLQRHDVHAKSLMREIPNSKTLSKIYLSTTGYENNYAGMFIAICLLSDRNRFSNFFRSGRAVSELPCKINIICDTKKQMLKLFSSFKTLVTNHYNVELRDYTMASWKASEPLPTIPEWISRVIPEEGFGGNGKSGKQNPLIYAGLIRVLIAQKILAAASERFVSFLSTFSVFCLEDWPDFKSPPSSSKFFRTAELVAENVGQHRSNIKVFAEEESMSLERSEPLWDEENLDKLSDYEGSIYHWLAINRNYGRVESFSLMNSDEQMTYLLNKKSAMDPSFYTGMTNRISKEYLAEMKDVKEREKEVFSKVLYGLSQIENRILSEIVDMPCVKSFSNVLLQTLDMMSSSVYDMMGLGIFDSFVNPIRYDADLRMTNALFFTDKELCNIDPRSGFSQFKNDRMAKNEMEERTSIHEKIIPRIPIKYPGSTGFTHTAGFHFLDDMWYNHIMPSNEFYGNMVVELFCDIGVEPPRRTDLVVFVRKFEECLINSGFALIRESPKWTPLPRREASIDTVSSQDGCLWDSLFAETRAKFDDFVYLESGEFFRELVTSSVSRVTIEGSTDEDRRFQNYIDFMKCQSKLIYLSGFTDKRRQGRCDPDERLMQIQSPEYQFCRWMISIYHYLVNKKHEVKHQYFHFMKHLSQGDVGDVGMSDIEYPTHDGGTGRTDVYLSINRLQRKIYEFKVAYDKDVDSSRFSDPIDKKKHDMRLDCELHSIYPLRGCGRVEMFGTYSEDGVKLGREYDNANRKEYEFRYSGGTITRIFEDVSFSNVKMEPKLIVEILEREIRKLELCIFTMEKFFGPDLMSIKQWFVPTKTIIKQETNVIVSHEKIVSSPSKSLLDQLLSIDEAIFAKLNRLTNGFMGSDGKFRWWTDAVDEFDAFVLGNSKPGYRMTVRNVDTMSVVSKLIQQNEKDVHLFSLLSCIFLEKLKLREARHAAEKMVLFGDALLDSIEEVCLGQEDLWNKSFNDLRQKYEEQKKTYTSALSEKKDELDYMASSAEVDPIKNKNIRDEIEKLEEKIARFTIEFDNTVVKAKRLDVIDFFKRRIVYSLPFERLIQDIPRKYYDNIYHISKDTEYISSVFSENSAVKVFCNHPPRIDVGYSLGYYSDVSLFLMSPVHYLSEGSVDRLRILGVSNVCDETRTLKSKGRRNYILTHFCKEVLVRVKFDLERLRENKEKTIVPLLDMGSNLVEIRLEELSADLERKCQLFTVLDRDTDLVGLNEGADYSIASDLYRMCFENTQYLDEMETTNPDSAHTLDASLGTTGKSKELDIYVNLLLKFSEIIKGNVDQSVSPSMDRIEETKWYRQSTNILRFNPVIYHRHCRISKILADMKQNSRLEYQLYNASTPKEETESKVCIIVNNPCDNTGLRNYLMPLFPMNTLTGLNPEANSFVFTSCGIKFGNSNSSSDELSLFISSGLNYQRSTLFPFVFRRATREDSLDLLLTREEALVTKISYLRKESARNKSMTRIDRSVDRSSVAFKKLKDDMRDARSKEKGEIDEVERELGIVEMMIKEARSRLKLEVQNENEFIKESLRDVSQKPISQNIVPANDLAIVRSLEPFRHYIASGQRLSQAKKRVVEFIYSKVSKRKREGAIVFEETHDKLLPLISGIGAGITELTELCGGLPDLGEGEGVDIDIKSLENKKDLQESFINFMNASSDLDNKGINRHWNAKISQAFGRIRNLFSLMTEAQARIKIISFIGDVEKEGSDEKFSLILRLRSAPPNGLDFPILKDGDTGELKIALEAKYKALADQYKVILDTDAREYIDSIWNDLDTDLPMENPIFNFDAYRMSVWLKYIVSMKTAFTIKMIESIMDQLRAGVRGIIDGSNLLNKAYLDAAREVKQNRQLKLLGISGEIARMVINPENLFFSPSGSNYVVVKKTMQDFISPGLINQLVMSGYSIANLDKPDVLKQTVEEFYTKIRANIVHNFHESLGQVSGKNFISYTFDEFMMIQFGMKESDDRADLYYKILAQLRTTPIELTTGFGRVHYELGSLDVVHNQIDSFIGAKTRFLILCRINGLPVIPAMKALIAIRMGSASSLHDKRIVEIEKSIDGNKGMIETTIDSLVVGSTDIEFFRFLSSSNSVVASIFAKFDKMMNALKQKIPTLSQSVPAEIRQLPERDNIAKLKKSFESFSFSAEKLETFSTNIEILNREKTKIAGTRDAMLASLQRGYNRLVLQFSSIEDRSASASFINTSRQIYIDVTNLWETVWRSTVPDGLTFSLELIGFLKRATLREDAFNESNYSEIVKELMKYCLLMTEFLRKVTGRYKSGVESGRFFVDHYHISQELKDMLMDFKEESERIVSDQNVNTVQEILARPTTSEFLDIDDLSKMISGESIEVIDNEFEKIADVYLEMIGAVCGLFSCLCFDGMGHSVEERSKPEIVQKVITIFKGISTPLTLETMSILYRKQLRESKVGIEEFCFAIADRTRDIFSMITSFLEESEPERSRQILVLNKFINESLSKYVDVFNAILSRFSADFEGKVKAVDQNTKLGDVMYMRPSTTTSLLGTTKTLTRRVADIVKTSVMSYTSIRTDYENFLVLYSYCLESLLLISGDVQISGNVYEKAPSDFSTSFEWVAGGNVSLLKESLGKHMTGIDVSERVAKIRGIVYRMIAFHDMGVALNTMYSESTIRYYKAKLILRDRAELEQYRSPSVRKKVALYGKVVYDIVMQNRGSIISDQESVDKLLSMINTKKVLPEDMMKRKACDLIQERIVRREKFNIIATAKFFLFKSMRDRILSTSDYDVSELEEIVKNYETYAGEVSRFYYTDRTIEREKQDMIWFPVDRLLYQDPDIEAETRDVSEILGNFFPEEKVVAPVFSSILLEIEEFMEYAVGGDLIVDIQIPEVPAQPSLSEGGESEVSKEREKKLGGGEEES